MENYQLGVIEKKFAEIVWDSAPLSARELVGICQEALNWKRTTTYTVLKKFCNRGFFQLENGMVTVLVSREEFASRQSERFVEENFHGSLPAMVVAFGTQKKLSEKEIDEMQKIIDSMRG